MRLSSFLGVLLGVERVGENADGGGEETEGMPMGEERGGMPMGGMATGVRSLG
jgi:hypothetical protein